MSRRCVITIAASADALPSGRSLDVGVWVIGGEARGEVPPGLRSLADVAEQLRERAYALAAEPVPADFAGALAKLARGQSAALMQPVRGVELIAELRDGADDSAEAWIVSGPRGPSMSAAAWVRDATAPLVEHPSIDTWRSG